MEKLKFLFSGNSEFFNGFIVGSVQTISGHPLDTFKTNIQSGQKLNIYKIYNGLSYPFLTNSIVNSIMFGSFSYLNEKINNSFISGLLAGIIISPIVSPIDKFKIDRQLNKKGPIYTDIFRGLNITCARESIGTAIYFSTYNILKESSIIQGDKNIMISGGIAGSLSWLLTYPIDVIKTRIQGGIDKNIFRAYNRGQLFKGLGVCLVRSFFVNGIGFYIYEKIKKN